MTTDAAADGAARAAAHADRSTADWSERAFAFLCNFALRRKGATFMTEDVRVAAEANETYVAPPDSRAWGAIILRAKRMGKLVHAGYAPNKDPSCHGSPKSVWRWVA